MNVKP